MKKLLSIIVLSAFAMAMVMIPGITFAQATAPSPADATADKWTVIIGLVLTVYELAARLIPTVKDVSILGKAIKLLGLVSDTLNKKKDGGTHA